MKTEKIENLVANLHNKTEYVIHIRNLKEALNHGLILKNFFRVIKFFPKTAGRGREGEEGRGVNLTHPSRSGFLKNVFSKERLKPLLFVIFNIIIRHIFPENFIEISQVV